jgi:hypothetical protein
MRRLLRISVIAILFFAVTGVGAEELELDPLLELLVEQGVITMEQALAVQAEYDRRRAAELVPTASPQAISSAPLEKSVAEEKEEKWYDRIDFKGDLRLRGEFFWVEGISSNDRRERFRARIRPGIYTDITDWMEVGLQVRSGDPLDPVSDNSSFDGGFSLIPLSISEGFAAFHPVDWLDLTFKASLYQYILEEDKETRDAYLLGGQLSAKFGSDNIGSITVGAGYDEWVRPQMVADMTLSGKLHGNRVTNLLDDDDQLISEFEIANAFVTHRGPRCRQGVRHRIFCAPPGRRLQEKGPDDVQGEPVLLGARCPLLCLRPVGHDDGVGRRRLPLRFSPRLRQEVLLQRNLVPHESGVLPIPGNGPVAGGLHHRLLRCAFTSCW